MNTETFDITTTNPLTKKRKEDVAKMRASLLSCTDENGVSIRQAIQNVTVLRIYHQLTRIIQYTELMDKLEAKMYDAINFQLDHTNLDDFEGLIALLGIQEKLQKAMIDSHKLLEPYLDIQEFAVVDLVNVESKEDTVSSKLINSEDRDKIRYTARAVLDALDDTGGDSSG